MNASIEEPIPALVARDLLVQLTSAKELGLDAAVPLRLSASGDLTWMGMWQPGQSS